MQAIKKTEMKKTETKHLLSVAQYAAKKKVSTTAVYNWIADGRVKASEIAGKIIINLNEQP